MVRKRVFRHNVTSGFGDYSNEIGMSFGSMEEVMYKMHKFETIKRISQDDLMNGTVAEDEVKAILEDALMKEVYDSIIFGKRKIESIATLSGRTKLTAI
ncbi:hypothetical protein [Borrelia hispanica]|uniref:hypothetical protein n=1 Tax=Borrelia hispanica TaxID=40835 RepID=UPI0004B6267C|nr:hypothetical protein [Borrelia hispanica]